MASKAQALVCVVVVLCHCVLAKPAREVPVSDVDTAVDDAEVAHAQQGLDDRDAIVGAGLDAQPEEMPADSRDPHAENVPERLSTHQLQQDSGHENVPSPMDEKDEDVNQQHAEERGQQHVEEQGKLIPNEAVGQGDEARSDHVNVEGQNYVDTQQNVEGFERRAEEQYIEQHRAAQGENYDANLQVQPIQQIPSNQEADVVQFNVGEQKAGNQQANADEPPRADLLFTANEQRNMDEPASAHEINKDQQFSADQQFSSNDKVNANQPPDAIGQINADEQLFAGTQIMANEQTNENKQLNRNEQFNANEQLNTDEQLKSNEQLNTNEQLRANERLGASEHLNTNDQHNANDHIPRNEQTDVNEHNTNGEFKADEQLNTNEQFNEQLSADERLNLHQQVEAHQPNTNEQVVNTQVSQNSEQRNIADGSDDTGAYHAGDVEKLVHGDVNIHDTEHHQGNEANEDVNTEQFGAANVEQLMHGEENVHVPHHQPAQDGHPTSNEEFKAGDVEQMVHGQGEAHVHDLDPKDEVQGPFKVGDVDPVDVASFNVHDPASRRAHVASAADMDVLMGRVGGGEEGEHKGGNPTVVDPEHLMHGEGGHDFDVRRLKLLHSKEDGEAKDRFSDVHGLVMHDGNEHGGEDETIRRGKTITYKDIMELGLDEDMLKGIDLKKLLLANAKEYDDWVRDRQAVKWESPESSFWEQIGELRKRYLSFGHNDGPARDLTGTRLDPEQQKWVSLEEEEEGGGGGGGEGEGVRKGEREDSIVHEMELLGSTAPKQNRHKDRHQHEDPFHTKGRDVTDL